MRLVDDVVVRANRPNLKCSDYFRDRAQQCLEPHTETAELTAGISAVNGADELACIVGRKCRHIGVEAAPGVILKKVLFHVR